MRLIDTSSFASSLPADWEQKAQSAKDAVDGKTTDTDRTAEVNIHSDVWRDLKPLLADLSSQKCWFCESLNTRSDNAVDHFRPKNSVAERSTHGGYWWLAFEWANYRFSCTLCNSRRIDVEHGTSGGKHDHFPLWDENQRACCPTDDCDCEQPMLLDPCCATDPALLWFDEDGQPRPNPTHCSDTNGYACKRAEKSIELYHLKHTDIVESRLALCNTIRQDLRDADNMLRKANQGDMTARTAFATAVRQVAAKLAPTAAYSMTARCMVMGMRGASSAAEAVLQLV